MLKKLCFATYFTIKALFFKILCVGKFNESLSKIKNITVLMHFEHNYYSDRIKIVSIYSA